MRALVVDGYNAIYKVAYLRKIMDKDLREARDEITSLAKEYQRKQGGIDKVYVVFDGKNLYRNKSFEISPNHVFSRTGEGDLEVIRVVKRLSKKYHVEVITNDNFVRNNSRAYNATVTGVAEFMKALNKQPKGQDERGKEAKTSKVTPEVASKINEELKKHWNL